MRVHVWVFTFAYACGVRAVCYVECMGACVYIVCACGLKPGLGLGLGRGLGLRLGLGLGMEVGLMLGPYPH